MKTLREIKKEIKRLEELREKSNDATQVMYLTISINTLKWVLNA